MEYTASMSRSWTEHEYTCSQDLWEFIDLQIARLELQQEEGFVTSSEACKLILFGKKEMLDALATFVHEHSKRLKEIADDHSIPLSEEPEDTYS
jgi:hypothetical protein